VPGDLGRRDASHDTRHGLDALREPGRQVPRRELESLPRIALCLEPGFPQEEPRDNVEKVELSVPGEGEQRSARQDVLHRCREINRDEQ
jgi:hypothetical protein